MNEHQSVEFRKKLRARNRYTIVAILGTGALFLVLMLSRREQLSAMLDFAQGFELGAFLGMIGGLLLSLINNLGALRKPARLKELYIKETDERNLLIQQKTGLWGFSLMVFGLLLASIVAGFFDQTVFLTLLGALGFLSLIQLVLKLYYRRLY